MGCTNSAPKSDDTATALPSTTQRASDENPLPSSSKPKGKGFHHDAKARCLERIRRAKEKNKAGVSNLSAVSLLSSEPQNSLVVATEASTVYSVSALTTPSGSGVGGTVKAAPQASAEGSFGEFEELTSLSSGPDSDSDGEEQAPLTPVFPSLAPPAMSGDTVATSGAESEVDVDAHATPAGSTSSPGSPSSVLAGEGESEGEGVVESAHQETHGRLPPCPPPLPPTNKPPNPFAPPSNTCMTTGSACAVEDVDCPFKNSNSTIVAQLRQQPSSGSYGPSTIAASASPKGSLQSSLTGAPTTFGNVPRTISSAVCRSEQAVSSFPSFPVSFPQHSPAGGTGIVALRPEDEEEEGSFTHLRPVSDRGTGRLVSIPSTAQLQFSASLISEEEDNDCCRDRDANSRPSKEGSPAGSGGGSPQATPRSLEASFDVLNNTANLLEVRRMDSSARLQSQSFTAGSSQTSRPLLLEHDEPSVSGDYPFVPTARAQGVSQQSPPGSPHGPLSIAHGINASVSFGGSRSVLIPTIK